MYDRVYYHFVPVTFLLYNFQELLVGLKRARSLNNELYYGDTYITQISGTYMPGSITDFR